MDLDYKVKYTDFSLVEISAIQVAKELFNSCKIKPADFNSKVIIENDTRERLLLLDLPKHVAEKVECFIRVISDDVFYKHNDLIRRCGNPVITMLGTVDLEKTLRGFLSDAQIDKCTRFKLACVYSCERHIFEIGQLLTTEELHHCYTPVWRFLLGEPKDLVEFWKQAYRNIFREEIHLRDLSQEACDDGFAIAVKSGNDPSVKYFVERVSPEAIGGIMSDFGYKVFSPTTYCLLFLKMTEDQQRSNISKLSCLLLQSLLRWPYQHCFLRAARLLTEHLLASDYWNILAKIFFRAREKCNDYDRNEMLVEYFEFGGDHRKQIITTGTYILGYDRSFVNWLRSKMSTSENEALLLVSKKYSLDL